MHVSFWVNHNDFGWDEHVSHLKMAKDCQVKYDDPDLKMFGRKRIIVEPEGNYNQSRSSMIIQLSIRHIIQLFIR